MSEFDSEGGLDAVPARATEAAAALAALKAPAEQAARTIDEAFGKAGAGLARSDAQLAQALARAVSLGARRL